MPRTCLRRQSVRSTSSRSAYTYREEKQASPVHCCFGCVFSHKRTRHGGASSELCGNLCSIQVDASIERDVGEAQSVFGKKLEARDKNLDLDVFPACEFHSHVPCGNCHTSDVAGCTLYIGNLLSGMPKGNLRKLFTGHGYSVNSTSIRMKGSYAFVNLATPSEARRAINELSENEILGSKLRIELASGKPRTSCDKSEGAAIGKERVSKGERYLTASNEEVTDGNFSGTRANRVSFSTDSAKKTENRLGQDLEDEEHYSTHDVILEVPPTPSTPPPGYTWILTSQWILAKKLLTTARLPRPN